MLETFTDEQFSAWLAGFFDGEGCIYIPKTPGIEISIANTNREVIEAIYKRTAAGQINEITFQQENWKNKYHWRVRTSAEIVRILRMMRPFLTLKAEKADRAIEHCERYLKRLEKTAEKYAKVKEMAQNNPNLKQREIAEHFGLARATVTDILSGKLGTRKPRRRAGYKSVQERHIKNRVNPKTETKIIEMFS